MRKSEFFFTFINNQPTPIRMKLYYVLLCSTLLSGKLVAQSTILDTCSTRFTMRSAPNCGVYVPPPPAPSLRNLSQVTLLGNNLTKGIRWSWSTTNTPVQELRARTGVRTAPADVRFRACSGNWVYYQLSGWDWMKSRPTAPSEKHYYETVHARVRVFGNEQRPDSLYLEFAQNQPVNSGNLYVSRAKDKFCLKSCVQQDVTPPTLDFNRFPVHHLIVPAGQPIYSDFVRKHIRLSATDDCQLSHQGLYPYRLDSFKVGQIIHYQYVAFDAAGNRSFSYVQVQFDTLPKNLDTCRLQFHVYDRFTADCHYTPLPQLAIHNNNVLLLGKTLMDGISWNQSGMRMISQSLHARSGSRTAPRGVRFSPCGTDWIYYTLSGNEGYSQSHGRPFSNEITNVHARVRLFGQLPNPDSLHIEFAENQTINAGMIFRSIGKQYLCEPNFQCAATDFTPPTYKNCPKPQEKPFKITLDLKPFTLRSSDVERQLPLPTIALQDNCGTQQSNLYPYWEELPKVGEPIPYHYVGYDKGGNKTICNFKVILAVTTNDLAVFLTSNPYAWQYQQNTTIPFEVTVENRSNVAHTNVKIHVPLPANTIFKTPPQPSIGIWKEICANGEKCYEWQIPNLPTNTTATLKMPVFVGVTTANIVATATLLGATPADNYPSNNQYTHTLSYAGNNPAIVAARETVSEQVASLYPNPTENVFTLTTQSLVEGEQTFDIYNIFGQNVFSENKIVQKGQNELFFDVSRLGKGVYFIEQRTQNTTTLQLKFVKL
jgi:Domain of unknown function DUF11/Secretion system C-terminal sorting domain